MIEVDRSRIIAYQRCPRERYLAYHHLGKGLQRKSKSLPLVVGSAFHEGAEELLTGNVDRAVTRATNYLQNSFAERGVGFGSEESSDATALYSAQEQMALSEGLIRAWGLERLPEFLSTFEVLEVEREGKCDFNSDLRLLFRPDALVRERLSGDLYVVSWKTASMYGKRTLQQCRTDMQSISEVWGIQNNPSWKQVYTQEVSGAKIEGVLYQFIVKGKRQLDDWDNQWKQNSHLIYGWKKLKLQDEFDDPWSWTFKWPKEDGTGNSTLGKGWKKVPIWSDYPGGVKAWIEDLHERKVFPRHIDPFESVFPQSLPIERRADEIEHWRRQTVAQELRIADDLSDLKKNFNDLDLTFPQYTHSCNSYSGCQFIDICHNGVPAEPGELYQIRVSNHPEGDDDES